MVLGEEGFQRILFDKGRKQDRKTLLRRICDVLVYTEDIIQGRKPVQTEDYIGLRFRKKKTTS